MRPSRSLAVLERRVLRRLSHIEKSLGPTLGHIQVAYASIELCNLIAEFCRALYLSSAMHAKSKQHGRVGTVQGPHGTIDAIDLVVRGEFPRYAGAAVGSIWGRDQEPPWFVPSILFRALRRVGATNATDVENAFSIGSRVQHDLPTIRNYFGHRNFQTYRKAARIGLQYGIGVLHPCRILKAPPLARPVPLLLEWLSDFRVMVELSCD